MIYVKKHIYTIFGTNWDNDTKTGTFYWNWNNVTSNARTNNGARLILNRF